MLDNELKNQLREVFSKLNKEITLRVFKSSHAQQSELLEMLNGISETSEKIKITQYSEPSTNPRFDIYIDGKKSGVRFTGIPGGHEFSSLVLAILNASGQGKIPDEGILNRIRNLKGPIRLKTYIALTCETCPDIVQALNLMALTHSDFEHEMIDGAFTQNDIDRLKIQGVPSIIKDDKLLHSGRASFTELLTKLEAEFGSENSKPSTPTNLGHFDVAIVGGGPAGASAAIYSARKGLKTLIIAERFGGQIQDTKGIENLISVVYTEGPQLVAALAKHMDAYPIQRLEHRKVTSVTKEGSKSFLTLDTGESLSTEGLIIATGAKWRELGVPGEKEYLGRGVAFCPHCDGPYYKGKKVAVVGGGNSGVEAAIDLAGIVGEVVLIEFAPELKADKVLVDKLKSLPNVSIMTNAKTDEVNGDGTKVHSLDVQNRANGQISKLDLDGVFVQIGLLPNSQFIKGVVETTAFGEIIVDAKGHTTAPGIYAAGDVTTTPYKQIVIAMGEGAKVALSAFEDRMKKSA